MKRGSWASALIALVVLVAPSTALAGDGTFPTEPAGSPFAAGASPQSVAIGDFNSDGNEDLALANNGGGITVRLGAGDGTFSTQPTGSPFAAGAFPSSVAIGDFNSDGNEDLAVANAGGGVTIRLGAGDGTFPTQPTGSPFAAGTQPYSVAIGDFNSDGKEDLAVANSNSGGVTIRLGAGDGTFPDPQPTGSPFAAGTQPRSIAIGDFDSNGDEDLAVANSTGGVIVRLGEGDGTFATQPTGSPFAAGNIPASVAMGDFNSDGREDMAVSSNSGGVTVRLGAGDGTFATQPTGSPFPAAGTQANAVAVGDFNSDGNEDLAVASDGVDTHDVTIRLGAGDGTFATEPTGSPFAVGGRSSLVIGDFDSDGNEDLAVAGPNGVTVRLGAGLAPLAGNLLTNGGFEGSGAGRTPLMSPAIPGWQRTATMTYSRYGLPISVIFLSHLDSPRFMTGGLNYLFGGPGAGPGTTTATQTVDVSASAASIDAGQASANLSAYLGGALSIPDHMSATAAFLDGGGAELGSLVIGPVTAADRNNLSTMLRRAGSSAVPVGTRQIRVTLTSTNFDMGGASAFADNVKLTLDAPAPQAVDPPPDGDEAPDTSAPDTVKGKGPKRRSSRRTATFEFSAEAGARFECKLDKRAFAPCTSPKKIKRLKIGKHVFKVAATDAAGNTDATPAAWRFRVVPPTRP